MSRKKEKFSLIDEDIVGAAIAAYKVQKIVEPNKDAVRTALSGALAKFEQRVQERIARAAYAFADAIQERTGAQPDDEGPTALREFGTTLFMELPGDDYQYEPEDGDIIEISLVGKLTLQGDECPNCHHDLGVHEWGITDRYTGEQFWFEDVAFSKARVRVVVRDSDFESEPIDIEGEEG